MNNPTEKTSDDEQLQVLTRIADAHDCHASAEFLERIAQNTSSY
jgi:hypothetical protein